MLIWVYVACLSEAVVSLKRSHVVMYVCDVLKQSTSDRSKRSERSSWSDIDMCVCAVFE